MSFRGIDIREATDRLVFRASLKDSAGAKVTSGDTELRLFELQSDGSLLSYDFDDNTFKSTALTTDAASMSHQTGDAGNYDTGVWTYALTTLTGFTEGNIYLALVTNSGAMPETQEREFQFGSTVLADRVEVIGAGWLGDTLMLAADTFSDLLNTCNILDFTFTTKLNGVAVSMQGSPSIAVYKGDSATPISVAHTLTPDFGGVAGLNHVRIGLVDTADGGPIDEGYDYHVVLSGGTVGGKSVAGHTVATFSVGKRRSKATLSTLPLPNTSLPRGIDYTQSNDEAAAVLGGILHQHAFYWSFDLVDIGTNYVELPSHASSTDDFYNGRIILWIDGTGGDQWDVITDYDGTTKIATVLRGSLNVAGMRVVILAPGVAPVATQASGRVIVGQNADKTGYRLSAQGVDDVWDEAQTGHTTAGTFGKFLDAAVSGVSAPTAGQVADAVWDEARSAHTSEGSFGEGVIAHTVSDKTGYALSSSGIAAIWNALTSGMATAGSIGKKLADWALGSDGRALVSANAHTAGVTVAAVSGNVGGNVAGSVGSVATNGISSTSLSAAALSAIQNGLALEASVQTLDGKADTLLARLTDERAGNLDNLDAQVSTLSTLTTSDVLEQAEAALEAIGLDHLFAVACISDDVTDNSFAAKLVSKSATASFASYDHTTESLEGLRDRGDAAWTTATGFSTHSAADVWAVETRTLSAFGFTVDINSNEDIESILAAVDTLPADPASQTGIDTLLARLTSGRAAGLDNLDATVSSRLATSGYIAPPSAGSIADAVWDEARTGHTTEGTFGYLVDAAISTRLAASGYTTPPSAGTIADAVWDEALSGHSSAGTAGKALADAATPSLVWSVDVTSGFAVGTAGQLVGTNLNATVGSRLAAANYTSPPTAGQVADAVWDEARSGHTTEGSFGEGVASVQGNVTGSVASVASGVTVTTNNDKTGYALSSAGVTAIWAALVSTMSTAGSVGRKLRDWMLGTDGKALVSSDAHTAGVTVAAVTGHTPQTGDAYAVVSSASYGNDQIKQVVDTLASRLTSARAGKLDNLDASVAGVAAEVAAARKLLEADKIVDTSTSPWQLVYYERGTSTELLRQELRETGGDGVTSEDQIVGQAFAP